MNTASLTYTEESPKAKEYLRLTLASLAKYGLSASPVNYTVWYDALSGKNLKLKKALETLVAANHHIDDHILQALYQKFVTDGDRLIIGRILTKVNLMVREVTGQILETEEDLAGHGRCLDRLADRLGDVDDYEGARELIDQMLEETRSIIRSGARLQTRMKVSSEDLKQLQNELETSQKQAMTDALTGIANRRGLEKRMELERIRARQNNAPFAVILLDIDFFKRVNDDFGHLVGDSLLRGFSKIIQSQIRKNDLACRYGGEEFLVLLPETDEAGAMAVANKIKIILNAKEWKVKDSGKLIGQVTASMGIALYQIGEPAEAVVQRADHAMYQAKEQGRNRINVHLPLAN